jgi:mannose-6-phosphate isomerase-like protein (cupin superfamily)
MSNYTAKHINDMEAGFGGGFVKARAELGVSSFGMQIIRMPADFGDYPEHDHSEDRQEEVYMALDGSGWIDVEGERVDLDEDLLVRIGPGVKRKVHSGPAGLKMLVVGGCPGEAYKAPEITELESVA